MRCRLFRISMITVFFWMTSVVMAYASASTRELHADKRIEKPIQKLTLEQLTKRINNDDIRWDVVQAWAGPRVKGKEARELLRRGTDVYAHLNDIRKIRKSSSAQLQQFRRSLLAIEQHLVKMMSDSKRFVVAHVLLTKILNIRDHTARGFGDGWSVVYNGLLVRIQITRKKEKWSARSNIPGTSEQQQWINRYWYIRTRTLLPSKK